MFCFPKSDHVMFSREFAVWLFINYAYMCTWIHVHKTTFERNSSLGVPSRGLKWENKTEAKKVYWSLVRLTKSSTFGLTPNTIANLRHVRFVGLIKQTVP